MRGELGGRALGGAKGGGSGWCFCRGAPPNSQVCGPSVIRQFAPPIATIEGRVSSAWVGASPYPQPERGQSISPTGKGPHRSVGVGAGVLR